MDVPATQPAEDDSVATIKPFDLEKAKNYLCDMVYLNVSNGPFEFLLSCKGYCKGPLKQLYSDLYAPLEHLYRSDDELARTFHSRAATFDGGIDEYMVRLAKLSDFYAQEPFIPDADKDAYLKVSVAAHAFAVVVKR